jgi:hypothetical protein
MFSSYSLPFLGKGRKQGTLVNKTILTTGVLFLVLLGGCDYLNNAKLSPEKKLALAEKCSKAGQEYFDSFIKTNLPDGYIWDEPQYHYSSTLNTCLIHLRYIKLSSGSTPSSLSSQRNEIIDIFSNKHILHGWFERDVKNNTETLTNDPQHSDIPNYVSEEYFKRKDKLFSE